MLIYYAGVLVAILPTSSAASAKPKRGVKNAPPPDFVAPSTK